MLSGLSEAEVQSHFRRKLTGRINGRAAVIINEEKEFSLVYKVNLNQCFVEFYYGVWNSAGFPLHHSVTLADASILLYDNFPFF